MHALADILSRGGNANEHPSASAMLQAKKEKKNRTPGKVIFPWCQSGSERFLAGAPFLRIFRCLENKIKLNKIKITPVDRSLQMFTSARGNKCCQPGAQLGQKQKNDESNYQLPSVRSRRALTSWFHQKKMNLISLNLFAQWKNSLLFRLLCFVSEDENKRRLSRREK